MGTHSSRGRSGIEGRAGQGKKDPGPEAAGGKHNEGGIGSKEQANCLSYCLPHCLHTACPYHLPP